MDGLLHVILSVGWLQEVYDQNFLAMVDQLPFADVNAVLRGSVTQEEVRVQYSSNKEFENLAKRLEIMSDLRVRVSLLFNFGA